MSANNSKYIYFDNAATTPLDKRVFEAMKPFFIDCFGNASSLHSNGTMAKNAIDSFREKISQLLSVSSDEIIFTSSGTESNNLALKGVAFANRSKGNHIIVSSIEHDCILNTCKWLETQGFYVTYLPVDRYGYVDADTVKKYIGPKTLLVSVMHANNEIGTIQPLVEIGKICRERNVYFHSDACQSFGKVPISIHEMNIDILTLNSHKIYGPKGVAALFIRDGVKITPLLHGGGQENGMRSSTENVAGIAGFSKAAELCMLEMETESKRLSYLRDELILKLQNNFPNMYINGGVTQRLPNNLNFAISGLEGETIRLLLLLDERGVAVSAGSACSNNDTTKSASHVLQAIGKDQFEARGAIRISLGRFNTENDIHSFLEIFSEELNKLKSIFS